MRHGTKVLVVVAGLAWVGPASAAEDGGWVDRTTGWASAAWDSATQGVVWAWTTGVGLVAPAAPDEALPDRLPLEGQAFITLLDAAGYRLAFITAGGGAFSSARYRFLQERVASPADRERVRRALEVHRAQFSGPRAGRHRRIVEALLRLAASERFRVVELEVREGTLPSARYHLAATERVLTESERRLLDRLPAPSGSP